MNTTKGESPVHTKAKRFFRLTLPTNIHPSLEGLTSCERKIVNFRHTCFSIRIFQIHAEVQIVHLELQETVATIEGRAG